MNAKEKLIENCKIVESGCWEWMKSTTKHGGYGRVAFGGRVYRAHRLSYEVFNGPIPDGLVIMHICDNPKCINPEHLKAATQKENLKDCENKGRAKKASGVHSRSAKLNPEQVMFIFKSQEKHKVLAEMFGVSEPQISFIKNRKTWRAVTEQANDDQRRY